MSFQGDKQADCLEVLEMTWRMRGSSVVMEGADVAAEMGDDRKVCQLFSSSSSG